MTPLTSINPNGTIAVSVAIFSMLSIFLYYLFVIHTHYLCFFHG